MSSLQTATFIAYPKAVLLLSFSLLLTLSACSKPENDKVDTGSYYQNAQLQVISPTESYQITHQYIGKISAKQQTNLSFEYSGKVSQLWVDSGDSIKKGQILAQQDTQVLTYQKAELQAQISQSKAQITLNQANLARIKSLIKDGYASKQNLDELTAENQVLHAQINGLQARIQTLDYQITKAKLIAPFNATVGERLISTGEVVAAGTPIYRLIEQNNNEITVGIPGKLAAQLQLGQTLSVELSENSYQAKLIAIGQQVDTISRTVQLRLSLLTKNTEQPHSFNGQLVRVNIISTVNDAGFWLPLNAITDGIRGQWQIFLVEKQPSSSDVYQIQTATVNILHTVKNKVYVSGLPLKDHTIISEGVHRFVAGQLVRSVQTKDKSQSDLALTRLTTKGTR